MYTGTSLASYQDARVARRGNAGVADRKLRLLGLALAVSLVLHALLLFVLPVLQEAQRARPVPPSLSARLARPILPEPAPPSVAPPVQPPPRPLASKPAAIANPAPQQAVLPPSAPAPIPAVEPAKQAAEPAPIVPVTPVAPPPVAPQAQAASGPDPGTVARFRLELMELARRHKKYPRIAQDNNWEGRVELRVAFSESGAMSQLSVKKGAGRAVLDEAAQAMIRSAQAQATIPPALRGKAFAIEIPVDFFLKDEER